MDQGTQQPEGGTTYPAFDLSVLEPHSAAEASPETLLPVLERSGTPAPEVRPTTVATDRTEAAKGAMMSGGDLKSAPEIYQQILMELENKNGYSQSLENIKQQTKERSLLAAKLATANALVDGELVTLPEGVSPVKLLEQTNNDIANEDLDTAYTIKSAARNPSAASSVGIENIMGEVKAKQETQKLLNDVLMDMSDNGNDTNVPLFVAGIAQAVLPFVESEQTRRILKDFEEASGMDIAAGRQAYTVTGSVKKAIRDALDEMWVKDPQMAERVTAKMVGKLRDNTNVLFRNDFSSYMRMQELFGYEGAEYTTFDEWIDNFGSLADIKGATGLWKTGKDVKTLGVKGYLSKAVQDTKAQARYIKEVANRDLFDAKAWKRTEVVKKSVVDSTAPTSPARLSEGVNPTEARALTEGALRGSEADAIAIYGTPNKGDIAVRVYSPTIPDGLGGVENKVWIRPDQEIVQILRDSDSLNKSEFELNQVVNDIKKSFEDAPGVVVRNNMTVIKTATDDLMEVSGGVKQSVRGDVVKTQVTYGLKDSGFRTAQDAYDQVEFALKDRGVTKEDMQLFKRVDDKYVPVKADEVLRAEKIEADSLRAKFAQGPDAFKGKRAARDLKVGDLRSLVAKGPKAAQDVIEPGSMRAAILEGPQKGKKAKKGKPKAANDVAEGDKRSMFATGPKAFNEAEPDYIVMVNHQEKVVVTDLEAMSDIQVAHNWVDRAFAGYNGINLSDAGMGSLNSFIFSPAAALKSAFTYRAASNAVDKTSKIEAVLLGIARQLSDELKKLPKDALAKMQEYVIKANREGLKFDASWARVNAWSDDMIQAQTTFRRLQDQLYYLENLDKVKSERASGGRLWINKSTGESQLVRPIAKNQVNKRFDGKHVSVYDSTTGKLVKMNHDEVMELYKNGGELLDARRPIQHEDGVITVIKSENNAGASYHRALNESDQLLSYRDGYYARVYKGYYFVRKSVKDEHGNHMYWKAVGNVDSKADAKTLRTKFLDNDPEASSADYVVGKDMKGTPAFEDAMHDLHQQGGRSAQRIRGEQLKKDLTQDDLELADTADPMEIVVTAIKSISKRTAMRDWFDTSKARLLNRYTQHDILPRDPNTNQVMYPAKASDIYYRGAGLPNNKAIADARTVFNNIRAMEDGYANFIDEGWKGMLNAVANTLTPWSGAEKAARAFSRVRGLAPVTLSRHITSALLLFSNVQRQLIIQPSQSIQLVAIAHPEWSFRMSGGQVTSMIWKMYGGDVTDAHLAFAGLSRKEFNTLHDALERSGQWEAVDKQNMVRGVLGDMADRAMASKAMNLVTLPMHLMRKVGIDFGERINSTATFLAFADQAKRAGKDLTDPRVIDEILSSARSFSGSMNEAGDVPYNHGALGVVFQFAQIGHKMIENMLTNQNLTRWQRTRLAAVNTLIFGIPAQTYYQNYVDKHIPEPIKEPVREGLLNFLANESIQLFSDTKTRVNFSGSMTPFNAAFLETVGNLVSTDPLTTFSKSPAGALVVGNNPKISTFVRELGNWFSPREDMSPSDINTVMRSFGDMFGGLSAYWKAKLILETGQTINTKGATADYHADYIAAMAKLFGFSTYDEEGLRALTTLDYDEKTRLDDVKKGFKIWANQIKLREGNLTDTQAMQECFAIGFNNYGGNPAFWEAWHNECMKGVRQGEFSPLIGIYESLKGTGTLENAIEKIKMLPEDQLTPDTKAVLKDLIYMKENKGELFRAK